MLFLWKLIHHHTSAHKSAHVYTHFQFYFVLVFRRRLGEGLCFGIKGLITRPQASSVLGRHPTWRIASTLFFFFLDKYILFILRLSCLVAQAILEPCDPAALVPVITGLPHQCQTRISLLMCLHLNIITAMCHCPGRCQGYRHAHRVS